MSSLILRQEGALNARGGFEVAVEVVLLFLERLVRRAQTLLHPDQRQVRARQFEVLLERVVVGREKQLRDPARVGLEQELLRADGDLDLPVRAIFPRMLGARDQARHAGGEEILVVRLRDEPVGAGLERADHVAGIGEGRQQDHRRAAQFGVGFDPAAEFEPVEPGHDDVGDDDVRLVLAGERVRFLSVARSQHVAAAFQERRLEQPTANRVVVHHEHFHLAASSSRAARAREKRSISFSRTA